MKKEIFSWLHLSDIHFQPETSTFNDELIRSKLPSFLEKECKHCDVVVFSGDFRYAPQKEETGPEQVIEYIRKITGLLDVDDNHVLMVPGNHDLNRSKTRNYQIKGIREDYNADEGIIDAGVLSLLSNDFDFYNSVQQPFKNSLKIEKNSPHRIIELDSCYFVLFNTSLSAGRDDDANKLVLGTKSVSELFKTPLNKKPIIAIAHHGFAFLENSEKKELTRYLDANGVRLYLCGHEHDNGVTSFGDHGKQVNVGCMKQGKDDAIAGFSKGIIYDNGDVDIDMFKWDRDSKIWIKDEGNSKVIDNLYADYITKEGVIHSIENNVEPISYSFFLKGYQLLGDLGCDGIKYLWGKDTNHFVESIAFNKRVKLLPTDMDNNTSAYTISTSIGCPLSTFNSQCAFCQTGTLQFYPLTAEDIALQCIFMAEYDSNCPSYPDVRKHQREFAFMGQGESGFCYDSVKRAILLNDYVMRECNQQVSRYIISTCGIPDFIHSLIQDYRSGIFTNRVTLHFSLNAIDGDRDIIMPVNKLYDYNEILNLCRNYYNETTEKIGVSILLMVDYKLQSGQYISMDAGKLKAILDKLDPEVFKIDFCSVNKTRLGTQRTLSNEEASIYLQIAKSMGFESKQFASIGDSSQVGCGVLSSSVDDISIPGNTTISHYNRAVELLLEAKQKMLI